MQNAIEVNDVTIKFNMAKEKVDSIKEYSLKLLKRQLLFEEFIALNGVSFNVKKGEVFGIIGLNGCGKSTILKIISGIYSPTKGSVKVKGTIAPLIELGAGFDMDLTARENIHLNGSVLGYSKKYIDSKFDEIVDFTELHQFIDVPMKNYSSGMVARIGFAIATITNPDILIVDEILSVGDFLFQQKCENRINTLMNNGTTILIVSHSIDQIKRLCNRVVWLKSGQVVKMGDTQTICDEYTNSSN